LSDNRQARQNARRQLMAETVMAEGAMRIEDIVERFGISLMTAHRDLDELESRGFLRKSRGVVSAAPTSLIEASDVYRVARQGPDKRAIRAGDLLRRFDNRSPACAAYRRAGPVDRHHQFVDFDQRAKERARPNAARARRKIL
jgi:DNA-binding Lrp family transcriptional regulator